VWDEAGKCGCPSKYVGWLGTDLALCRSRPTAAASMGLGLGSARVSSDIVPQSPVPPAIRALQATAVCRLLERFPLITDLGERFTDAGFEIALVGGGVRDALLGDVLSADVDLTTNAEPERSREILADWGEAVWDTGIRFGTVAAQRRGVTWEVTTYRADSYQSHSRKPEVQFGDNLSEDLRRRDFTVNAMAVRLPSLEFVDEHNGLVDLSAGRLRTPGPPEVSFSDDPLRMMRAARFASQLGLSVADDALRAMTAMSDRLTIVSAERIQSELSKLLLGEYPRRGLELMTATGLAEYVLPELPKLKLEVDEHHHHKDVYEHTLTVLDQAIALEENGPDLTLRFAAVMHDVGKPKTRRFESGGGVSFHHHEVVGARMTKKRLKALRFGNELNDDVTRLVELHLRFHGYGTGEWSDSAVRRYVRDAGPLLQRLHVLTRADCTTRNKRRARELQRAYDDLEDRIAVLASEEELAAIRPELDGKEIMSITGWGPGPRVGEAYKFLLDLRLDGGPIGKEAAAKALQEWVAASD
jgi:poly(A) polymerase